MADLYSLGGRSVSIVRFLDTIAYDDSNLTREERVSGLREVHSKTAEYFAQPLPRQTLKDVHPARIATVSRTISHFVVYCWPYVPRNVQVDISIWASIINVLEDEISADPAAHTADLWTDLLAGRPPSHPFWKLMQVHLPRLLAHFDSFCAFNIMRSTIHYFEGCWIEQHSFQGWRRADYYPMFVRRLTTVGGGVAGSLLPSSGGFDDQALFKETSIVMAHIDGIVALPNDLFSFSKEFDQDEPNLTHAIHARVRILELLEDKDAAVRQTIRGFIHGYVTWHFCELRYRMGEVYHAAAAPELGGAGAWRRGEEVPRIPRQGVFGRVGALGGMEPTGGRTSAAAAHPAR
ncbi:Trichodiene synthase [Diaporthe eres]|nr:Trichodiene synthase [Diaporthe eres]